MVNNNYLDFKILYMIVLVICYFCEKIFKSFIYMYMYKILIILNIICFLNKIGKILLIYLYSIFVCWRDV